MALLCPARFALLTFLVTAPFSPAIAAEPVDIGIVINPYAGDRAGEEKGADAKAMLRGLPGVIRKNGGRVVSQKNVALTAAEET